MRYRPFGVTGMTVSSVALAVREIPGRRRAADWMALTYAALECGINVFDIQGQDPNMIDGVAHGLAAVERRLVFAALHLPDATPDKAIAHVEAVLARTGLGYLDLIVADLPTNGVLPPRALEGLEELRRARRCRLLGLEGDTDDLDDILAGGLFDVLAMPFHIASGWRERHRLKAAMARDMAVIGYGFHPEAVIQERVQAAPKASFWRRPEPLQGVGGYGFLAKTDAWSSEEICLAYALTEPSLATVRITPTSLVELEALAAVPDRDLPSAVAAQIEMARFQPEAERRKA